MAMHDPTDARDRTRACHEIDGAVMLRALAHEDALLVFAAVVEATATGSPQQQREHDQRDLDERPRRVPANRAA